MPSEIAQISGTNRLRAANKAAVAEFFEVSIPTVENWVRRGCPVVCRGSKSKPWVFDVLAVAEWRIEGQRPDDGDDPDKFPPADRKAWYDGEAKKRELQIRDRELIHAAELESCIARVFAALSQGLRSIPDNLERRAGCSPEIAEAVERMIESEMDAMADVLSTIGPTEATDEQ